MNELAANRPPEPFPFGAILLRSILNTAFIVCGGIARYQLANIPARGPVIFCPNHISDSDPGAIYVTCPRRDLYFMAKSELFDIPILGTILRVYGTFGVNRDTSDRAAIRRSIKYLEDGNCLVMFGEGRVSNDARLQPIKPGVALIALQSGASIVPVGLSRTNLLMPYGHVLPKHSERNARVVYGKPIVMEHYRGMKSREAIPLITSEIDRSLRLLTGQAVQDGEDRL